MSDRDTITLPRVVVKFVLQHLEWWSDDEPQEKEAITALRTALAAEPTKPKPEPVAWVQKWAIDRLTGQMGAVSCPVTWGIDAPLFTCEVHHSVPLYAAPPDAPTVKDSLTVQSRLDAESFREERDEARALLNGVLQDIEALRREDV